MREHIEHILAAFGAFGFALFIFYFSTGQYIHAPSATRFSHVATLIPVLTPLIIPLPEVPVLPPPEAMGIPSATSVPPLAPVQPKKKTVAAPRVATTTIPKTVAPVESKTSEDKILGPLAGSVVNILCTSRKSPLRSISGTGVIIDSRGIILTVAHVAQVILLEQTLGPGVVSCVVRTGSPATAAYKAKLLYISEPWLKKNSTTLISSQPKGTGENDFALLAITDSLSDTPLPSSFPFISLSNDEADEGDTVGLGSYGAQYLTSAQVTSSLQPIILLGKIKRIYTFGTSTRDVLAVLGGDAAQEGSSGGAVVNTGSILVGLITTSEISGATSTRQLRAITPEHIRTSYSSDTGTELDPHYSVGSLATYMKEYAPKAEELGNFLAGAIGLK